MESKTKAAGSSKTIQVGPWGGLGGSAWDDGSYSGIREIILVYGQCIDSIQVEYDKHGKPVSAEKHGGNGGIHTNRIKLEYPQEFLTTVSGHYSPAVQGDSPVIRSLRFKTNRRTFGPFGAEVGTPFTLPIEGGMIVGFSGRSGWYLDAIGLHLSRISTGNIYDSMQLKLQKLGPMASKFWGHKTGVHGLPASAKTPKALA